ncbi:hypothetical protein [Glycomyces sp. NPDC048151]|uniref:hypothetical protein n=1 Tax=Glycomyces sp. NPDC048151 TaxID=3364002 RepID=UPI003712C64E
MSVDNFIPEIWAAATLAAIQDHAVVAALCNRGYEGEARRGNAVNITGVIPPEVKDYKAAGRTTEAEEIEDAATQVLIDQEKSFDFLVDDIDRTQAAGGFGDWTTAAGRSVALDADRYITSRMVAEGTDATSTVTVHAEDGDSTHDVMRDMRKALSKASIDAADRYFLMNPEFEALLLGSDAKITSVDTSGSPAGLREAIIGRYLGFTLVPTNSLPEADVPQAVAFWAPAVAYVSQIDTVEAMRSHTKFADRLRGLHVYGARVLGLPGYNQAVQVYTYPGS